MFLGKFGFEIDFCSIFQIAGFCAIFQDLFFCLGLFLEEETQIKT